MNVRTQDGLITDLSWWNQMRVEKDGVGDEIVLSNLGSEQTESGDDEGEITLTVVKLPGQQEEVQALFTEMQAGIRHQREVFDVIDWVGNLASGE